MATEPFLINPPRKRVLPRTLQAKKQSRKFIDGKSKARKVQSKRNRFTPNPLGEAIMIVGANPTLRRTKMLENAWFGHPVEHRRAAVKGWRRRKRSAAPARKRRSVKRRAVSAAPKRRKSVRRRSASGTTRRRRRSTRRRTSPLLYTGATPFRYANNPRRRRRSRRLSSNPRRRGSRRMRRNPASLGIGGMIGSFRRALPLAVTGGAAIIATNLAPSFAARYVGSSNIAKYGVQVATAVVGGIGVSKFVGREHGTVWTVSGLAVIVADLAQRYLLNRFLAPAVAGFGEYEMGPSVYGVNAFPEAMNAYPEESVQGFGGFGEVTDPYSQNVGPY